MLRALTNIRISAPHHGALVFKQSLATHNGQSKPQPNDHYPLSGLVMSTGGHTNFFVHPLLRAHNWQHRPELDRVCDWWRGGGRGICALVGMGGAGKTAIAERFLRILPGGLPADPDVAKDSSLPTPHSAFVFSFYDAPNPEAFFEALQMWLEHTPRIETVLSVGQMLFLLQQTPGLVVMDGLEKVQEDGSRGTFGRLSSPKLRDFLDQLAAGYVPDLSVLITSRFPLADLRDKHPQFFRTQPVDQIDVAAGVQLLRDRGVRGTDGQLAAVVEQCGRHALTVDFAGGYLAEYAQGDPATPLDLGTAEQLQAAAEREPDEDRRAVIRQGHRFARIAGHYRKAMLRTDEAAMALLERICLFRLGVACETLAAIFTGPEAEKVSGKPLAGLNREQIQRRLDWLVRMRLLEESRTGTLARRVPAATEDGQECPSYSIHPAVRDGFLSGISRDAALAGHEAARKGLEVTLGDAPGENPSDPATLDLLEEIVHHTLQSGHVPEAWDIYWNRIGGFKNLGWRLGAYERGERICRAFAGGATPESIRPISPEAEPRGEGDQHDQPQGARPRFSTEPAASAVRLISPFTELPETKQATFINDWALYLHGLGRLAAAVRCYELQTEMQMRQENWANASIGNQNLCEVCLLSGRLSGPRRAANLQPDEIEPAGEMAGDQPSPRSALQTAAEALRLTELADDAQERQNSHANRAHARALRGGVSVALADFSAALELQHEVDGDDDDPLYGLRGIWHTHLLARLGRREGGKRLTETNQGICQRVQGERDQFSPKCKLVLSALHVESGELSAAERLCASARTWAEARDAKEVLCWSALVQAQHVLASERHGASRRYDKQPQDQEPAASASPLTLAHTTLTAALKIARDCGFGLYHIDLLLERARLHLLRGNPDAALADVALALDTGIPADPATGQQELLAANDECCGYVWAIPAGLQLRAEAQLLQAAQQLGSPAISRRALALRFGHISVCRPFVAKTR